MPDNKRQLTRRELLLSGLGLVGVTLVNGCAGGGTSNFSTPAQTPPSPYGSPPVNANALTNGTQPKSEFGRRLEPAVTRVLHGAGQTPDEFTAYASAVAPSKPLLYMSYFGLNGDVGAYFQSLQTELASQKDVLLIPQIGLSMAVDGKPDQHYEQDVAAGKYDTQIEAFCQGLADLKRPAFVRIGYDFNDPVTGYKPDSYKAAWARITKAVRTHSLNETALVWSCAAESLDKKTNMFYPGDTLVDWWAIDLFAPAQFTSAETVAFLKNAAKSKFPVMISASAPRQTGIGKGEGSWKEWFAPYFDLIQKHSVIKAFCYVNADWSQSAPKKDWGNALIGQNPAILKKYQQQLTDVRYIHAGAPADIRTALSLPPLNATPTGSQVASAPSKA